MNMNQMGLIDLEGLVRQYIDPEFVKWALSKAGIDLERLKPPHFSDANFSDMNQMGVHYFISFYPIFMAACVIYALYYVFTYVFGYVWHFVQGSTCCSINIKQEDPSFKWVNTYMQEMKLIAEDRNLRAAIKKPRECWSVAIFKVKDEKAKPEIEFKTGAGDHVFQFKGKKIWVHHAIGKTIVSGWERRPENPEELYIVTYGRDSTILKEFIETCMEYCIAKDKDKINIYELHRWWNGWTKIQKKDPRPLDSVILDKDLTKTLCEDITKFHRSEQWYFKRGIPYRRGYLLYGPPGTGKTSFTLAVAGALKLNICYLNLSSGRLDDDSLNDVLAEAPPNSIILLEDIDAIFVQRESVQKGDGCGVSFSGLLNALDGVRSQEGRILFMTTNHREKLDPALLRPGRCDVHVELCNATFPMIKGLFLKFFPGKEDQANEFAKLLPEKKISMAKLQGHYLMHRHDPTKAIESYNDLLVEKKNTNEMTIAEWLDQLNLYKYLPMFTQNQVYLMNELKYHLDEEKDYGQLNKNFKFKEPLEEMRIKQIIQGDEMGKEDFMYLTEQTGRRMLYKYIKNDEILDELVDMIEPNTITGFQLKDIIISKFSPEDIGDAIKDRVERTKKRIQASEDPRVILDEADLDEFKEETEDEKKKRHGFPDITLEKFFEQIGDKDQKFFKKTTEELDINIKLFWTMEEKELLDSLAIEPWGLLQRFKMNRDQMWKDHQKACEEADKEKKVKRLSKEDKDHIKMLLKETPVLHKPLTTHSPLRG